MIELKDIETVVLEDDEDHRNWIEAALEEAGLQPFSLFANSESMMSQLTKEHLLVVVDFWLSETRNGAQVVKEVKEVSPNAYIIIMSGQTDAKVFIQLIKAKADDYVDKNNQGWLEELKTAVRQGKLQVIEKLEESHQRQELVCQLTKIRQDIHGRRNSMKENDSRSDY